MFVAALSLVSILDLHDFIVLPSHIKVLKLVNELTIVDRSLILKLAELALVLCDLRLDVLQITLADASTIGYLRGRAWALRLSLRRCFGCSAE